MGALRLLAVLAVGLALVVAFLGAVGFFAAAALAAFLGAPTFFLGAASLTAASFLVADFCAIFSKVQSEYLLGTVTLAAAGFLTGSASFFVAGSFFAILIVPEGPSGDSQ